jgi:hypothetical protein
VFERNSAGLKKLLSFVWTEKWLICFPKSHLPFAFSIFRSGLSDIRIYCNRIREALLYNKIEKPSGVVLCARRHTVIPACMVGGPSYSHAYFVRWGFRSHLGEHWLSCRRLYFVCFSPSKQMAGEYFYYDTIASFQIPSSSLSLKYPTESSRVLYYDRRSVGQSVLVSSTHLGLTIGLSLLSDSCGFVDVGRSLWREDGSLVYNCCWPSPAQLFSGPSPVRLVTMFLLYQVRDFHLIASYDSQDYGGGIRPRLHTENYPTILYRPYIY